MAGTDAIQDFSLVNIMIPRVNPVIRQGVRLKVRVRGKLCPDNHPANG